MTHATTVRAFGPTKRILGDARSAEVSRARQDAARLDSLVGALSCGVLLIDDDDRITLANAALPRTVGIPLTARQLEGMRLDELAVTSACRHMAHLLPPPAGAAASPALAEVTLPDGRVLEYERRTVSLDGASIGQLVVYRDVSLQAASRRQLRQQNRTLAELVALKTEFVVAVSHELRTPLTSILTFAGLLDEYAGILPDTPDGAGAVRAIERNAERMLSLIDDLLLAAQMESGTLPLSAAPVDLDALVAAATDRWRPVAADRGVALQVTRASGAAVAGDLRWLRELVEILMGVAIATAPADGTAYLTVETEPTGWRLRVPTHGGAIDGDAGSDRLYTTIGSVGAPSRSVSMALMLGRAIVGRHHGTITTGSDGGRAELVVRLPFARSAPGHD